MSSGFLPAGSRTTAFVKVAPYFIAGGLLFLLKEKITSFSGAFRPAYCLFWLLWHRRRIIVTYDEETTLHDSFGDIDVIPCWKLMLYAMGKSISNLKNYL